MDSFLDIINHIGAAGLMYDLCGVVAIGQAMFSYSDKDLLNATENRPFVEYSYHVVRQQVEMRMDMKFGTSLLFVGFILQFLQYINPTPKMFTSLAYFLEVFLVIIVAYYMTGRSSKTDKEVEHLKKISTITKLED